MTVATTTEIEEIAALATRLELPLADLDTATEHAARLVPERWARKYAVLALSMTERRVTVATADPFDVEAEHTLAFATGREITWQLAPRSAIVRRIDEVYRSGAAHRQPERLLDIQVLGKEQQESVAQNDRAALPSMVSLVDELISDAIAARASDLHI